jgi:hypothetical protein
MRILVTGSRGWPFPEMVWSALEALYQNAESPMVLVHGACKTGADAQAEEWASSHPDVTVERYHADWATYGRGAGPRRNQLMVDLGADACLAYIFNSSRGASGCALMAEKAGIPTKIMEISSD